MKYSSGLKWVGDLSLEDADVLSRYAMQSPHILEFGCGGSTQIFSQCGCYKIVSVETNTDWVKQTLTNLQKIDKHSPVEFLPYTTHFNNSFQLIFVDGIDHLRREFAINTWKYLDLGGVMIFHDTRRFQDFQNAAWVSQLYFNEIVKIDVNQPASNNKSSNLTVLHKKQHEPYVNWNFTEDKPQWAYGSLNYDKDLWTQN